MASTLAPVVPSVLTWARTTAGLSTEDAASRIGIRVERLEQAEAGEGALTLNQARKAAEVYRRPFAVLFLPEAPSEEPVEVQFRRFRDAPALPWPSEMRGLARRVPALQEEAAAIFESLDEPVRWQEAARALASDSNGAGLREFLGVTLGDQKAAAAGDPKGFGAFRLWREAIEAIGILVLQDGSLSLDEMRGFAAPHPAVPALVLNTQDDVRARLFTMLHELSHLLTSSADESHHDRVAASMLMPAEPFSEDFRRQTTPTFVGTIDRLARLYGATPDATAVRIGWLGLAPWPEVNEARQAIRNRASSNSAVGGGDYYRNVLSWMGPGFVSRVIEAVDQSTLSELAAARVLGIRLSSFEGLRRTLRGGGAA